MKTRRQKMLEDRQIILGRFVDNKNSLPIPDDLIFEIFLKLPAKCIARCRCVSKFWASILGRQEFTDQFLKRSSARPQLLLACKKDGEVFFFSTPEPQNPDENSSPTAASYHMSFPFDYFSEIYTPVNGLVCISDKRILQGRKTPANVWVICNPSTGQSFTLPRMKTRIRHGIVSFLGYDPIEKQFKVLSMTWRYSDEEPIIKESQILTLETEKLSWRMIECGVPHYPGAHSICINGVLYYKARPSESYKDCMMIICFDVRSEKYSFIKVMEPDIIAMLSTGTLINYTGKLASFNQRGSFCFTRTSTSFEMWVLDDPEKKEWSNHIYQLPPLWHNLVADAILTCVGVTGSNEIVLAYSYAPFYVYYYSLERETIRRVEIQGMGAFLQRTIYIFPNHVEDVKIMKGVSGLSNRAS